MSKILNEARDLATEILRQSVAPAAFRESEDGGWLERRNFERVVDGEVREVGDMIG